MKKNKIILTFAFLTLLTLVSAPSLLAPTSFHNLDLASLKTLKAESLAYASKAANEEFYSYQKDYQFEVLNATSVLDTYRGEGVTIAVIDTGVRYDAAAYSPNGRNVLSNRSASFTYNFETKQVETKIVSRYHDDYSILAEDPTYDYEQQSSPLIHGTSVTGTIKEPVNNQGGMGLASEVELIHLKLANLNTAEIAEALNYIYTLGDVDIINMSLGFVEASKEETALIDAIFSPMFETLYVKQGVLIFAASGNDNTYNDYFPACNDYVISIGALAEKSKEERAYFSTYGYVDLMAPGYAYSPYVKYVFPYTYDSYDPTYGINNYAIVTGTSFASPLSAASAALYQTKYKEATNEETRLAMFHTAIDIDAEGRDIYTGYGRIDVEALLNYDNVTAGHDGFVSLFNENTSNVVTSDAWYELGNRYHALSNRSKEALKNDTSFMNSYNQIRETYNYDDFLNEDRFPTPVGDYIHIVLIVISILIIIISVAIIFVGRKMKTKKNSQ